MTTKNKRNQKKTRKALSWGELVTEHITPHTIFSLELINLAIDVAMYYHSLTGLSGPGVTALSLTMPCWVTPHARNSEKYILIGGLTTFYVGRAASQECELYCHIIPESPDAAKVVKAERQRLLASAPLLCRDDIDGGTLLKRIWKLTTPAERRDIYDVTAFTQMARRLSLRTRNLPGAPNATTRKHYEQMEIPFPQL